MRSLIRSRLLDYRIWSKRTFIQIITDISEHLAKYLKVLAEFGEVAIVCDHKFINKKQGDDSPKALGISALITDAYGVQTDILLAYIPVNSSTNLFTVPLLEEVLMEFQLWDAFKKSKIAFSVDYAMSMTVNQLFRNNGLEPLVTICQVSNFYPL